jgi:hypothetical protein
VFGAAAHAQNLDRGGQEPEEQGTVAGRGADHDREDEQHELIVAGDPLPGLGHGGHIGNEFPVALCVGATIAAGRLCASACMSLGQAAAPYRVACPC